MIGWLDLNFELEALLNDAPDANTDAFIIRIPAEAIPERLDDLLFGVELARDPNESARKRWDVLTSYLVLGAVQDRVIAIWQGANDVD